MLVTEAQKKKKEKETRTAAAFQARSRRQRRVKTGMNCSAGPSNRLAGGDARTSGFNESLLPEGAMRRLLLVTSHQLVPVAEPSLFW